MSFNIKTIVARVCAIGAVRRKGLPGLGAYGGKIEGEGEVIHKSGPNKGKTTRFKLSGDEAAKS